MYSTWKVSQLKEELKKRGATIKGKKADLVERLEHFDRNFNFDIPQCSQVDDGDEMMTLPTSNLYHDVNSNTLLPLLLKNHIRYYFDQFNKKIDQAEKLYESRFLLIARSVKVDDHFFIKGFCKKTMKKLQYEVDIKIHISGAIEQSHCECPAGAGIEAHCKHVGVLLFAVAHMVKDKIILLHEGPTQKLQTFHKPNSTFTGSPIKAECLPSKNKNLANINFHPYPLNKINKQNYFDRVRNILLNFPESRMPLKQLYEPANPISINIDHFYEKDSNIEKILKRFNLNAINEKTIEDIELATRCQSNSKDWQFHRKIRLTASNFHTICHLLPHNLDSYAQQLLNRVPFKSRATMHGIINEKVALNQYRNLYELEVIDCGLIISKDKPFLGASPDGLLSDDTVIEIKCPYVSRNKIINSLTVPYLKGDHNGLTLKTTSPCYYQIQGQLYCSKRKYANLIVYTFKDMKVIYVSRNEDFIKKMLNKLENFYENHFKDLLINKYLFKNYEDIIKKT